MPVKSNSPASLIQRYYFASLCNYSHITQGKTNGLLKIKWKLSESLGMFWLPMQTGLIKKEMHWLKSLDFWRRDRPQGWLPCPPLCVASCSDTRPHTGTEPHPQEERERQALSVALLIRRLLPETPGRPTSESHSLEQNYWSIPETIPLAGALHWLIFCPRRVNRIMGQDWLCSQGPPWSFSQFFNPIPWGINRTHDMLQP